MFGLLVGDGVHHAPHVDVTRVPALVVRNQRAVRLAHAALACVLERDGEERRRGLGGRNARRCRSHPVLFGERGRGAGVADLVARCSADAPQQVVRRAVRL